MNVRQAVNVPLLWIIHWRVTFAPVKAR